MNLNIKLICLGADTEIKAIAQVNGNELETVITFDFDNLSLGTRSQIVDLLQNELTNMSAGEIIGKLAK